MDLRSFIILLCLLPGAMALDEGLSGLIIAGVIAGVLFIVGIISVTIWCFVRNRDYDEDKESLDIISPKVAPRYSRFPHTMKFRSYAPTSTRARPPVTFFTVRDSPRSGGNPFPITGTPYLYQPRGPVMYVEEGGGVSARSSVKDREGHYRRSTKSNGHVGSMKIRELQSGDEMMNFESSDDENGNKKKTMDNRSRSKSRDRKYVKNPDHKSHHRHKPTNHSGHRSRSNSRGRNQSVESRNSINSNTIVAQPGDIILNPIVSQPPPPVAHNISQSTRPESLFVPVITRNPISQTLPTSSAFQPYTRDEDPPLDTPREDYLTPRSVSEMPSTIQPESSRSDYITPSADYPRTQDLVYPPRPSSNDPFISPRPPTPEFDADSILYAAQGQVTVIHSKSPTGNVFESTPRPGTPPMAPPAPPAPPPPMPIVEGSTDSGYYLSAVHRPPTPPPGKLLPVSTNVENILNSASSSGSISKRPTNVRASPLHDAMMAEIKNRRQRRPSSEDIGLPPSSTSSGESPSLSFRRNNDSPIIHFGRFNDSPVPSFRRQTDSPSISDARRPSNVQFAEDPPEIIPRGLDVESPDYEPGSVSAAFDAVMSSGVPSAAPAPPPPPPPPPLPSGR